jgi:hypothetical protein
VLELDDGTAIKLAGASPQQFPARLLPDATRLDVEDLDELLGPDPGRVPGSDTGPGGAGTA